MGEGVTVGEVVALFREAVACALVAGAGLGVVGVLLVLRRRVFLAATLAQASGMGVVLALAVTIHLGFTTSPLVGALAAALAMAGLLAWVRDRTQLPAEAVLAGVWLATSAATSVLGDLVAQESQDVEGLLSGSAVLVRTQDLAAVVVAAAAAVGWVGWKARPLVFGAFDPDGARVQGVRTAMHDGVFLALATALVAASTRALGVLPTFAFSVLPATAALSLAPSMAWTWPVAATVGAVAGGAGFILAVVLDLPVGPTEALTAALIAGVAAGVRWLRRR